MTHNRLLALVASGIGALALTLAVLAVFLWHGLFSAPSAKALTNDESQYVIALTVYGITVKDPGGVSGSGHQVCEDLKGRHDPWATVSAVMNDTGFPSFPARGEVHAAAHWLCKDQDKAVDNAGVTPSSSLP